MVLRLYHGSKSGLGGNIAPTSRDACDFGRGFYMGHYLTGESSKEIFAQCDENLLLQCYGFHSEANEMAIEDIKAISRQSRIPPAVAEAPAPY